MQFKTNPTKRGKTADVTFSPFTTLSIGSPYVELGKLQQHDRNENAKKQIVPAPFRPSHPSQKPNGSGAYYGAFSKNPNVKTTNGLKLLLFLHLLPVALLSTLPIARATARGCHPDADTRHSDTFAPGQRGAKVPVWRAAASARLFVLRPRTVTFRISKLILHADFSCPVFCADWVF